MNRNYQTGLIVIEVNRSNPNGDPDSGGRPREFNGFGAISPQSIKRKVRDVVSDKNSPFWQYIKEKYSISDNNYGIAETSDGIQKFENTKNNEEFLNSCFDARVFGTCMLPKKDKDKSKEEARNFKTSGFVSVGTGVSVAPVSIWENTITSKKVTSEDKEGNMAPMAWKLVEHGIYTVHVRVCPNIMHKTCALETDIDIFWEALKQSYNLNPSSARPDINILHMFVATHNTPWGSCPEHLILDAITPRKIKDIDKSSKNRLEYEISSNLPENVVSRISGFKDMMISD